MDNKTKNINLPFFIFTRGFHFSIQNSYQLFEYYLSKNITNLNKESDSDEWKIRTYTPKDS